MTDDTKNHIIVIAIASAFATAGLYNFIFSCHELKSPQNYLLSHPDANKEDVFIQWSHYKQFQYYGTLGSIGAGLALLLVGILFTQIMKACFERKDAHNILINNDNDTQSGPKSCWISSSILEKIIGGTALSLVTVMQRME